MGASPAFSFYAKDFLTGTATMSLAERGAYVSLLAYQWDSGFVPSNAKERARVLGCTSAEERRLWSKLVSKFMFTDDAFRNPRLEEERAKQADRKQRLSDNGKLGGRPHKAIVKQTETNSFSEIKANENLKERLSSSSSGSQEVIDHLTTKHRGVGVIVGPAEYARLQEIHAFVGSKLRVPHKLHRELLGKSGANAEVELQAWYLDLNDQLEESGKGTGDVFEWLRPRHQVFATQKGWIDAAPKAADAKPRPRGVAEIIAEREAAKGLAS